MEFVTLGRSDLRVSRLGFGCCPLGGHGWGKLDLSAAQTAIARALDEGVNFFDSADVYGEGQSEVLLGEALRGKRDRAIVATKFGVRLDDSKEGFHDNSPAWLDEALDASLKRLGTDYVDLYQVHYRDGVTPIDQLVEALERKREQGKIRYYGLSNPTRDDLRGDVAKAPGLVSFQMELSLANRRHEPFIRQIRKDKGWTFLSWGSLGQGILSGKYGADVRFHETDRRSRDTYVNFHGDTLARNLAIVDKLKEIDGRHSHGIAPTAIRWILDALPGSVVLVGIKSPEQLERNLAGVGWALDETELALLDDVSLSSLPPPVAFSPEKGSSPC